MKKRIKSILILIPLIGILLVQVSPKINSSELKSSSETDSEAVSLVATEAVTPTPAPTPTPEPTPSPTPEPPLPIDADGNFTVYGRTININDEFIDFSHMAISDGGAEIASMIPYMPNLKAVDMDSCGVSDEEMGAIQAANPTVEVIWRINFGDNYSVRTNVTKILASKPSKGGELYDDVASKLKYCTKVRYLDLGHNENLHDFSFVQYMPDLEIAIVSITAISDLTPFASCPNLLYLEAGNTDISDLSPLASCTKLAHLNIGTCGGVTDISPLYELPLYRLWLGSYDPVPSEQVEEFKSSHPQCIVDTECPSGIGGNDEGFVMNNWKYYQNYTTDEWNAYAQTGVFPAQRPIGYFKVVYKAYQYNLGDGCYSFSWNDPNYEATSHVDPVNTYVIDTSLLSEYWEEDPSTAHIKDILTDPPGDTIYVDPY